LSVALGTALGSLIVSVTPIGPKLDCIMPSQCPVTLDCVAGFVALGPRSAARVVWKFAGSLKAHVATIAPSSAGIS
jgi:hypothetical protein